MHLVTTSIEKTWPEDKDIEILFLGEWCKLYSRKTEWEKRKYSLVSYHWDNRKKLKKDYKYLNEIYENLIPIISKKLNNIHKVNHSFKYWRIIVGPWLSYFIQILYDRWYMLQSLSNLNSVSIIEQSFLDFVPNDMSDFINAFIDDDWNEFIYSMIIQKEKLFININYIKRTEINKKVKSPVISNYLKNGANEVFKLFNKIFTSRNKYFFIQSYIPTKYLISINLRLNQFPTLRVTNRLPKTESSLNQRKWDLLENSNDKFLNILNYLIPLQIPKIYLEGFSKLKSSVKRSHWPLSPRVIFTSNSYSEDDYFKAWAAEKIEKNSKLIIAQHGGHFGMTEIESHAKHQYLIADKFISWGWNKKEIQSIKPVGNIKIIKKERQKIDNSGYCLFISTEYPRFSYYLFSVPIASQYKLYLKTQVSFLELLPQRIFNKILYRPSLSNFKWYTNQRLLDSFPQLKIDQSGKSFKRLLKNSRICIITYNGTTFLESFAWDFPTIIFFDSFHWELNDKAKASFETLKKANIYHTTADSAAQHLINVWDDTKGWWDEPLTRSAVSEFSKTWNVLGDDIIKNLIREIK